MLDLLLLAVILGAFWVAYKAMNHTEHKCIFCFAEKIVNKLKGFIK